MIKKWFLVFLLPLAALISCSKAEQTPSGGDVKLTAPESVTLHSSTENSLTFKWKTVEGATSYAWKLTQGGEAVIDGIVKNRSVAIEDLESGTEYEFKVCAKSATQTSAWSEVITASTQGTKPEPGPDPDDPTTMCVDAPLVVSFDSTPVLGTSGLIQVFSSDGTLVDKIDMADMANVTVLDDGTMIPATQINNETVFHTFMDALHSTRYRPVHYTPLRINGKTLEIKLHNEALSFGQSYYMTMDESVAGKAIAKDEYTFTVKAKPSGTTLKVNADGSADFCTVQGALSHATTIGKDTEVVIEVANGTYREMLFLRDKNNLTIRGESRDKTIIIYPNNESYSTGSGQSTSSKPRLGSAVGVMGGRGLALIESCNNLVIEDLTIENSFSNADHRGQAETIYFNADGKRLTIQNCNLISWQDTFLCKGEVWVYKSLIAGHVDFIWGYPKACLFEECEIRARAKGYIVQARINNQGDKGFVFLNCKITSESGVAAGGMYLARSGGDSSKYDNVSYINCEMTDVVASVGWYTSPKPTPEVPTATSGWKEYGTKGVSTASRNAFGRLLTAEEAQAFSSKEAVLGW